MGDKPLVSCIVTFQNSEPFLKEAIQSVSTQTYDRWELLLIDRGSTDGSVAIARDFANRDPEKIRYLELAKHETCGIGALRNFSILHSQGRYIAFLPTDSVWLPQKLEQQVEILETHPEAAMAVGRTELWFSWTKKSEDVDRDRFITLGRNPDTLVRPPELLARLLQDELSLAAVRNGVFRREAYNRAGGFDETVRGFYADSIFYACLCCQYPVYISNRCWDRCRQHFIPSPQPTTDDRYQPERERFLNSIEIHLSKRGDRKTAAWDALQQQLWPYRHPGLDRLRKTPQLLQKIAKTIEVGLLPAALRYWLGVRWHRRKIRPWIGWVRFGALRRLTPISNNFGFERGQPLDRYYIEQFLSSQSGDIRGRVLEIRDPGYTYKFGGDRVTQSDVLDADENNPTATLIADLTRAERVESDVFDCIILTQTLQFIYDIQSALKTLYRILKPGGVLLMTLPSISQFDPTDTGRWGDYWRFTTYSARRLVAECFPGDRLDVKAYGNVLTVTAFLYGVAAEELSQAELVYQDPKYELLIAVRAVKPELLQQSLNS
ncbi:glycosyltransferase [Altericista sp. CCNU0014]|uniref:glycosyltransferase n=1 Tax=Altericista sp. CCNU0014 TaxID=3082949 RepID=UPI00384C65F5